MSRPVVVIFIVARTWLLIPAAVSMQARLLLKAGQAVQPELIRWPTWMMN
ncbi:MAG: hypothetical protein ABII76_27385 [Pseudomonadota bacterium]